MVLARISLFFFVLALLLHTTPTDVSAQDATRRDARFVLDVTAGAEIDYLPSAERGRWSYLGWRRRGVRELNGWGEPYTSYRTEVVRRTTPLIGPLGTLRCFLGVALPDLGPALVLAFGYSGQVAAGMEQIDDDGIVVLQRHGLSAHLRVDGFVVSLGAGYVRAAVFDNDIENAIDGWFIDAEPGLVVDGFVLRVPVGVDAWQDAGTIPAIRVGLAVGGTML